MNVPVSPSDLTKATILAAPASSLPAISSSTWFAATLSE